jgi:hypothetical protein
MIPKSGYRFSEKIMLHEELERDDDSKKSHHALSSYDLPNMATRCGSMPSHTGVPRMRSG